jgi:L-lactate dehydrogenase complex protein LldG
MAGETLFGCQEAVFLAGPSATGDIEGVLIHGAQGARSLTVLLFARAGQ